MSKMFSLLIAVLIVFSVVFVNVGSVDAASRVKGYTTKRGTYVQPYYRSNKNTTKFDNYSTRGNVNPYNGKKGYVNPYKSNSRYSY